MDCSSKNKIFGEVILVYMLALRWTVVTGAIMYKVMSLTLHQKDQILSEYTTQLFVQAMVISHLDCC